MSNVAVRPEVEDMGLEPMTSCMPCKHLLRFSGVFEGFL